MKPGDLVELVRGGPPMTILQRNADRGFEGWLCVWQVNGTARRATFPEQALRRCDPQRLVALPPPPVRARKVVDIEPLPDRAHAELLALIDNADAGGFDFSIICSGDRWTVSVKLPEAGTHTIGEGADFQEAWSKRKPAWNR
ncbi:hypothetical protein [Lichenicoccus sp.]|uniref:hypothetical protein n=1 Tax=Lichenicoccus sp. TaxID=2781899 RepID=UPI003D10A71B